MELMAMMMSEEALVCDVLQSDPDALNALIDSLRPKATALAYTLTGNRDDALDAVQNALTRVFARPESRTMQCPVIAAVYQSVHSAAVDLVRRRAARKAREATMGREEAGSAMEMQDAERRETIEILRNELSELPAETAAVITLHHMDDLPVDEVSKKTGLSVDACKHRLSRGREQLRQRLERRGVALASLALMAELLHEAFLPGKACAAELAGSAAAQAATSQAISQNAAHTSAQAASKGAVKSKAAAQSTQGLRNARGRKAPESHTPGSGAGSRSLKSKLAAAGIVLALIAGSLPFLMPRKNETPVVAPTNGGTDADAEPRKAPAPVSRWQSVEVCADRMVPISLQGGGHEATLLTTEFAKEGSRTRSAGDGLHLFTSGDDGAHWSHFATLPGYSYGALSRISDGQFAGVGVLHKFDDKTTMSTYANSWTEWHFLGADWLTVGADGKQKSATLWRGTPSRPLFGPPAFIRAGDANWVFAQRAPEDGVVAQYEILIATSQGDAAPKPVTISRKGPADILNRVAPLAWAVDGRTAGFVYRELEKQRLTHVYSVDGGATWTDVPLPFNFDTKSDTFGIYDIEPLALARENNRLVVLFSVTAYKKNADDDTLPRQEFTMISEDLGKTWKAALPIGAPADARKICREVTALQISGDRFLFCANNLDQPDLVMESPRHVSLEASMDAGATWNPVRSVDLSKNTTDGVLLCSTNGVYVGVRQVTPEHPLQMLPAKVLVHHLGAQDFQKDVLLSDPNEKDAEKRGPNF